MNTISEYLASLRSEDYTILIVDDNPTNLEVVVNSLREQGFNTLIATDGEIALERAEYVRPDLILLDVIMPGIDGFETCRRLKMSENTKQIPIIFMTALTQTEDKVKAFAMGGVDYITKPLQYEEILVRVATHLRIHELTRNLQIQAEELQRANQSLQDSLETLQLAQNQLIQSEKMAALGNLVAGIAHEINTPLGIGVTATSYLQQKTHEIHNLYMARQMTRSDLEHYWQTTEESTAMILGNLNRAAEQIRSFKQVAVDQTTSEKRRFNVKSHLQDLLLSLHPKLKRIQPVITIHCREDLEITSYPGAFSQIMTNLIMNSLQHGFEQHEQGKMSIDIYDEIQDNVQILQIRYHDNGRGMTSEELTHIFEPFYTTKRGQGGTGLGLHIVYALVTQRLKGQIECQSTPGVGTTFLIQFHINE